MLRLIRERGTIFELFRILQLSTPMFAAGLIQALNADIVDELIGKTIAAQRSIGTLYFTLHHLRISAPQSLALLEKNLRPEGIWRLVEGAGDLGALPDLLESLSAEFVNGVLAPECAPDVFRWRALMRRGGYRELALFLAEAFHHLRDPVRAVFVEALSREASAIVAGASWTDLARGISNVARIVDTSVRAILHSATSDRLRHTDLAAINIKDFLEVANCLRLLWRYRPPLQTRIACQLWDYLPPEREWPTDHARLIGGQLLLEIASSTAVLDTQADRLLAALVPLPSGLKIEQCSAAVLWRFLWSLYAFWAARRQSRTACFVDLFDPPTWERLVKRLQTAAGQVRHDGNRLSVLALAGALGFCAGIPETRLREAVAGRLKGFNRLLVQVDALAFLPAALANVGLSLIGPSRMAFSSERVINLIAKSVDYEERGLGVDALCAFLTCHQRNT
jgi:hypothetical protein